MEGKRNLEEKKAALVEVKKFFLWERECVRGGKESVKKKRAEDINAWTLALASENAKENPKYKAILIFAQ